MGKKKKGKKDEVKVSRILEQKGLKPKCWYSISADKLPRDVKFEAHIKGDRSVGIDDGAAYLEVYCQDNEEVEWYARAFCKMISDMHDFPVTVFSDTDLEIYTEQEKVQEKENDDLDADLAAMSSWRAPIPKG